jgi:hypothetical protein
MLVFDNNYDAIILDSIHTPTVSDHVWVLDLNERDFMLTPLQVLEETICPTLELLIWGFKFWLPANWNILVVDPETQQLDVVEISELPGKEFSAFVYGPRRPSTDSAVIQITDYLPNRRNVGPSINKHHMLCHPISNDSWVNVSPSDTYNKYLKNAIVGDLI